MEEIWKDIEDYEGLYQVSSMGRVKSLERLDTNNHLVKEKILKGIKIGGGYLQVSLCKDGLVKRFLIHRLVSSAFLDNPNNLSEINHIDEDKTNNCVDNLEWCSKSYNINYGNRNEIVSKANSIPILQFSKTGEFIRKWEGSTQVKKELDFNQGFISMCCRGEKKSAYGYKWCYHYKSIWLKKHIPLIKQKKVA